MDDWLPYAEDLIKSWSNQATGEVKFLSTFEIDIAALLLIDDLLPPSARVALANLVLTVIEESIDKKLRLESLHIAPPSPGRQQDRTVSFIRFHQVKALVQSGMALSDAYKAVAEESHKSPDTIRRDHERTVKKTKENHKKGAGKFG